MLLDKNKKAFTLIELLVSVAIIGLLATISIIALNSARARARDAKRVSDIKQMQTAIEFYYNNHGHYPQYTTLQNCSVESYNALNALVTEGIMSNIPRDPKFQSTVVPRMCYNYLGIGTAQSYGTSGLYCGGRRRTDYQWTLMFSTESESFDFPEDRSNNYSYCVHGDLLPGL